MQIQQGDVNIESVNEIPQGAKKVNPTKRGYILAEGEATGHAHRIEDVEGVDMYESNGMFYFKVSRRVQLMHEEHNVISINPGIYKSWGVLEYDPFEEEINRVQD